MRIPILVLLVFVSLLSGAAAQQEREIPQKRTLRVLIAGTRPLPKFEQHGNKVIEVDPDLKDLPPTSFSIGKKQEEGRQGNNANTHSAWINELVTIEEYTGSSQIAIQLRRPLTKKSGADIDLSCDLGNTVYPLIVIYPDLKKRGWDKPRVKVIDLAPEKVKPGSVLMLNLSNFPLRAKFNSHKPEIVSSGGIKMIPSVVQKIGVSYRYRIDAAVDKREVTVSNSAYQMEKNARLIMLAMNTSGEAKNNPVSLRLIHDAVLAEELAVEATTNKP